MLRISSRTPPTCSFHLAPQPSLSLSLSLSLNARHYYSGMDVLTMYHVLCRYHLNVLTVQVCMNTGTYVRAFVGPTDSGTHPFHAPHTHTTSQLPNPLTPSSLSSLLSLYLSISPSLYMSLYISLYISLYLSTALIIHRPTLVRQKNKQTSVTQTSTYIHTSIHTDRQTRLHDPC